MGDEEKPSFSVHPGGIEPPSSEPESGILSIELRVHGCICMVI